MNLPLILNTNWMECQLLTCLQMDCSFDWINKTVIKSEHNPFGVQFEVNGRNYLCALLCQLRFVVFRAVSNWMSQFCWILLFAFFPGPHSFVLVTNIVHFAPKVCDIVHCCCAACNAKLNFDSYASDGYDSTVDISPNPYPNDMLLVKSMAFLFCAKKEKKTPIRECLMQFVLISLWAKRKSKEIE